MTDEAKTEAPATEETKTDAPVPGSEENIQAELKAALEAKVKGEDAKAAPPKPEAQAAQAAADRRAARIAEAEKVERKNAERREAARASSELARVEEERARIKTEREQWEAERKERAEAIKKGGPAALKAALGIDLKDLNQQWIAESDPAFAETQKLRAEIEEAKKESAELKAWREERAASEAAAKADEGRRLVTDALEQKWEDYPFASNLSSRRLHELMGPCAAKLGRQGKLSLDNLLAEIDEEAKLDHDDTEKRRAARKPVTKPSDGKPASQSSSTAIRGETRTLTSGDAGKKSSERKLTEEEEDEIFKAQLRDAMKRDAEKAAKA